MEIFGIGPQELFFILLIAIIVLGPKDMQKAGKTVGRWLNRFMKSDGWKAFQRASREIRNMPNTWMREANLEELKAMERELRNTIDARAPVTTQPKPQPVSNQAASAGPEAGSTKLPESDSTDTPAAAEPTDPQKE